VPASECVNSEQLYSRSRFGRKHDNRHAAEHRLRKLKDIPEAATGWNGALVSARQESAYVLVFSTQENIPYERDQKDSPKQENCAGHLEIRIGDDALLAHPLQCPRILNGHYK
jgi:hypothetical protein